MKEKMLAMILAGGKGTRLGKLTKAVAKPAVPFGGRYRIIDFAMSNCVNSGIYNVGVITQYKPLELNAHIGGGEAWGMSGRNRGATILQPYSNTDGEKWFQGTAHAIFQNIEYIDQYQPDHVLILSGDHIYKMNYDKMLTYHCDHKAALTVAVIPVPEEEASRFGIMNTDKENRIIEFEEKPAQPKSNLASMGIYIFDWPTLRQYLLEDEAGKLEDFGKDVIPQFLADQLPVYAYAFEGYWKDVGTIESLWQANMEFLEPDHALNIRETTWRVYSNNTVSPALFVTDQGDIRESMVADGCYIAGEIERSVLGQDVTLGEGSKISNSVVMSNVNIKDNCTIRYAIIGEDAVIEDGAEVIGTQDAIKVIGYSEVIGGHRDEKK